MCINIKGEVMNDKSNSKYNILFHENCLENYACSPDILLRTWRNSPEDKIVKAGTREQSQGTARLEILQ